MRRPPSVSATTSVRASGRITVPLGNMRSSAATVALPSASTRMMPAGLIGAPDMRSKPKFPTYARPWLSTTMSLRCHGASSERSAWTSGAPPSRTRRTRRSRIETTSIEPSGIQPSPDGCAGTLATVSGSAPPSRSTATTSPV